MAQSVVFASVRVLAAVVTKHFHKLATLLEQRCKAFVTRHQGERKGLKGFAAR